MLSDSVKSFLIELKMKGSSEHTISNYNHHLQKFIAFVEENNINLQELTPAQARLFRNQLVEKGLKPSTINTVLSALKGFFDFLLEEGLIKGNPILTKRLRVKEGQRLPGFLSPEELRIVNEWLTTIPDHVSLGFRTMLATGLRVSEAAAITPRDIIVLDNGGYILRVRHGKGDKERYAPIMDAGVVRDMVRFVGDRRDDEPLFGLSLSTFKWWAQKCRLETQVNFHSHRCRHTVGTQLLQKGVPIDQVQDILGHADISTTRRYAKTSPEAVLKLAARIDEIKESRAVYRYLL